MVKLRQGFGRITTTTRVLRAMLLGVLLLVVCVQPNFAQSIYATLTGVVADPTGAVVPQAKVTLKNEGSGDVRRSVTNAEGYFTFAAVPVGSYTLSIEAPGFLTYQVANIALQGAERRNVDVNMQVGSTEQTVSVSAVTDLIVPVDSGEK